MKYLKTLILLFVLIALPSTVDAKTKKTTNEYILFHQLVINTNELSEDSYQGTTDLQTELNDRNEFAVSYTCGNKGTYKIQVDNNNIFSVSPSLASGWDRNIKNLTNSSQFPSNLYLRSNVFELTKGDSAIECVKGSNQTSTIGGELSTTYAKCGNTTIPGEVARISRTLVLLLKIVIPFVIICMGIFDFVKAVTAKKDDDFVKARTMLMKRLAAGAICFVVISLVQLVVTFTAEPEDSNNFMNCISCLINDESSCQSGERPFQPK